MLLRKTSGNHATKGRAGGTANAEGFVCAGGRADAAAILTRYDGVQIQLPREPTDEPDHKLVAWRWKQAVEVTG